MSDIPLVTPDFYPELPPELLRQIVRDSDLERRDLWSLSLSSRILSAEAYLVLYENVHLEEPRVITSALGAFSAFSQVAELVRTLTLVVRPADFGESWFSLSDKAVDAIHNMKNLRELGLNYLWASDPQGPSLKTKEGVAWTRKLYIPQVETLKIDTSTYRPFHDLFGELRVPLPKLRTIRPVHVNHIDGITHVACERIYGQRSTPLNALKTLEVWNLESFTLGNLDWAPNLITLALVTPYISTVNLGWGSWCMPFEYLKHVKKIGPIFFWDLTEPFSTIVSQLTELEVILLVFSRIPWRDFGFDVVERMVRSSPNLRKIAVACADFEDLGGKVRQVKTFRRDMVEMSGPQVPQSRNTAHQWEVSTEQPRRWEATIRALLELE